jgi:hypothetical protein
MDGAAVIHPRFVERLGKIYVDKLLKDKMLAREWSHRFLPQELVDPVAAAAKQILKKRGFKVLE